MRTFEKDLLSVSLYETRAKMGEAADAPAARIEEALK